MANRLDASLQCACHPPDSLQRWRLAPPHATDEKTEGPQDEASAQARKQSGREILPPVSAFDMKGMGTAGPGASRELAIREEDAHPPSVGDLGPSHGPESPGAAGTSREGTFASSVDRCRETPLRLAEDMSFMSPFSSHLINKTKGAALPEITGRESCSQDLSEASRPRGR